MRAYHLGWSSYYGGKSRMENPFNVLGNATDYDRWEAGWLDAKDYKNALEIVKRRHQVGKERELVW